MSRKIVQAPGFVRLWFGLTANERLYIAVVLLIALIGLFARHAHLKRERAVPFDPAELEQRGY
ncbi:MAG TPA: hypothetical protein PKM67_03330 [Kiritimatiellia bacterium]|nr:hypothetical protein [Kiritimatiellia bacterium]HNS80469.1 hypothetical protein [Kiritimatiellia bacterium]HPA77294.1 hypothetical protein [Kiritimatiellia bacterium]HQQ03218.1 hypothetical protein [Kiritimatiellia bacterium]